MRKITFREVDFESVADLAQITAWLRDPEIQRLTVPDRKGDGSKFDPTLEMIRSWHRPDAPFRSQSEQFILESGTPIGMTSLILNPPHRLTQNGRARGFRIQPRFALLLEKAGLPRNRKNPGFHLGRWATLGRRSICQASLSPPLPY